MVCTPSSTMAAPMAHIPIRTGDPTMQRLKKDLALAELPAPVVLTPDQLVAVAAGTAALLKPSFFPVIVAGGIFGPTPVPQTPTYF
jgi:hypothetical protein